MKKFEHIFFDLDHTLWDFDKNSEEALNELFYAMDLHKTIEDFNDFIATYKTINAKYWSLYNYGKVNKKEVRVNRFIDVFEKFKITSPKKKAEEISIRYLEISPYKTNLFPNTHETLRYLKERYKLHIITNGFHEVQHIKLNQSNLSQYFDLILCSEEVGVNKPNPLVFNTALKKTNANAHQSIMVGDNLETDIQGAKNCGIHAVHFNPLLKKSSEKLSEIQDLKDLTNFL